MTPTEQREAFEKMTYCDLHELDWKLKRFYRALKDARVEAPDADCDTMLDRLLTHVEQRQRILTDTIIEAEMHDTEIKRRRVALGLPEEPEYDYEVRRWKEELTAIC